MRASVLQFQPRLGDRAGNLHRLQEMLAPLKTDLVVLPELVTSGYLFADQDELLPLAEEAGNSDSFYLFHSLSTNNDFSIVYGYPEFANGRLYNSCMLINPDGSFYNYRKVHLFDRENLLFSPGNEPFRVHPAKGDIRVGMMICFDWIFPESMRSLALQGAQLICHPANLVLPWCQQAMKVRALENRVFCLTANRFGEESNAGMKLSFTGASQILDCQGDLLTNLPASGNAISTVDINPELADNKQLGTANNLFTDRKPEYYSL